MESAVVFPEVAADRARETSRRMRPPVMAEVPAREGGRWRRPGVVGRDRGFANSRAFLRTLDVSREQNVFGGTESGYTALCADKSEKQGHDGNPPRPRRPKDRALGDGRASRRRTALREIVFASTRRGRGRLDGRLVCCDARNEA